MKIRFWSFALLFSFAACGLRTGVFEKDIAIPGQQWESSFKPLISFKITDTSSLYNIYLVIRHTDAYNYNNIWIRASIKQPGDTQPRSQQFDLTLATNEKGWIGSAMDDIYESRILIQPQTKFKQQGDYSLILEQIMRENPLKHILNAGVRVEKTN